MKRFRADCGFLISLLLNLLFHLEWIALAFVLFLLHVFAALPVWPVYAALGIWFGGVFVTTLVLYLLAKAANAETNDYRANKNPYSAGAKGAVSAAGTANAAHGTEDSPPNKNPYSRKTDDLLAARPASAAPAPVAPPDLPASSETRAPMDSPASAEVPTNLD